jgi:hypothetical protein
MTLDQTKSPHLITLSRKLTSILERQIHGQNRSILIAPVIETGVFLLVGALITDQPILEELP